MYDKLHYLRIQRRVIRRLLLELPPSIRDIIANDVEHKTEQYKWFDKKVKADALRLYEDANYYDNQVHTVLIEGSNRVSTVWCKPPH